MISLSSLLRKRWQVFALGQLCMLVAAAAALAFPWTVRNLFGSVLGSNDVSNLLLSIGVLGGVLVVRDVADYAKRRVIGSVSERMVHSMREQIYDAVLSLPSSFFDRQRPGAIASAASNDVNAVQAGLTVALTDLMQQAFTLVAVVTMLFVIDPILAATVCLFVPPIICSSRVMARRASRTTERRQRVLGEIMNIVQQSVAGMEVIRSYLLEGAARAIYREQNDESYRASIQSVGIGASASLVSAILGSLFLLTVMGVGGFRVIGGALTAPDLIAFILYSEMVTGPFVRLASLVPEIAKARTAYRRIGTLLEDAAEGDSPRAPTADTAASRTTTDEPAKECRQSDGGPSDNLRPHAAPVATAERREVKPVTGMVEMAAVSFSYEPGQQVLHEVSFRAEPGEVVALVGPSGAGKSTVIRLIPRLYRPSSGSILIDGTDIDSLGTASLRSSIGVVSQNPFLFDLSVRDNIRCGDLEASDEAIEWAAAEAYAQEFIERLPEGYDTQLGEGGSRLSGGQRQRIAIARAFLKDPRILLLDEATSALDTQSERFVQAALRRLAGGRTTIVIAHRLETIRHADRIVVLDEGTVVDVGAHEDLVERCELYRSLYRAAETGSRHSANTEQRVRTDTGENGSRHSIDDPHRNHDSDRNDRQSQPSAVTRFGSNAV